MGWFLYKYSSLRAFLVLTLLCVMGVKAATDVSGIASRNRVVMVHNGVHPEGLLERVRKHSQETSGVLWEMAGEWSATTSVIDLSGRAHQITDQVTTNDIVRVLFYAAPESVRLHTLFDTTNRVAVINTTAMRDSDMEVWARRLDRQAMRAFYFTVGLSNCPHPLCCLFPYDETHTIDMIGRNGCPPCQFRAENLMNEQGVVRMPKPRLQIVPPPPTPPPSP